VCVSRRRKPETATLQRGFTLIELLITIVVLGVLGGIVVFGVAKFRDDANTAADQANLVQLNRASTAYNASAPAGEFNGLPSDTARMNRLFDRGLLTGEAGGSDVITPAVEGAAFVWSASQRAWQYFVNNAEVIDFASAAAPPSNYPRVGAWTQNNSGWVSPSPGGGLIFIPNPRSEYTINVSATLGAGPGVGYGVLFNTTINGTKDTGYALQFDRGLGAIVIRPRTNGTEAGTVKVWNSANTGGLVPSDRSNSWWTDEHTITVKVTVVNASQGTASVSIDGTALGSYTFNNPVPAAQNYTGFRTWYASNPPTTATFHTISIS